MKKTIIYFRHGQTDYNKEHKFQGSGIDAPINKKGIEQANNLKDIIDTLDVIYSSPLKRALQTAKIVSDRFNIPININNNLIEINYGIFEGKKKEYIKNNYPKEYKSWFESNDNYKIPESDESKFDLGNRLISEVKNIAKTDKNNTIGICAHGRLFACARLVLCQEYKVPKNSFPIKIIYDTETETLEIMDE